MKRRLLGVLVLAVLGLRLWWVIETEGATGGPTAEVVVPSGASVQSIAESLHAAGVVPRVWSFVTYVRFSGDGARLKAGRYRFEGPYSLADVRRKLVEGNVERREITFPEGRNIFDMAGIAERAGLSRDAFLEIAKDPAPILDLDPVARSLEGYLFPETYEIRDGTTEKSLVDEMLKAARTALRDLGIGPEGRTAGGRTLTLPQIVTLASIVEMETAKPGERPRIAGVFLNRLRIGMALQTDPTVIYAMELEGRYQGNIRKSDLSSASPYNTYRFAGLPPGPIASPGRAALRAVLEPEDTDALYFVSRNDGTHVFSKDLRSHERAVDEFQRRRPRATPTPSVSAAAPTHRR